MCVELKALAVESSYIARLLTMQACYPEADF